MKKMLVIGGALIAMSAATAAFALDQFGLYHMVYYTDASHSSQVGVRYGSCTYTEVVLGPLQGQETAYEVQEFVGLCIDGAPFYY